MFVLIWQFCDGCAKSDVCLAWLAKAIAGSEPPPQDKPQDCGASEAGPNAAEANAADPNAGQSLKGRGSGRGGGKRLDSPRATQYAVEVVAGSVVLSMACVPIGADPIMWSYDKTFECMRPILEGCGNDPTMPHIHGQKRILSMPRCAFDDCVVTVEHPHGDGYSDGIGPHGSGRKLKSCNPGLSPKHFVGLLAAYLAELDCGNAGCQDL